MTREAVSFCVIRILKLADSMNWLVIAVIILIVLATLAGAKRGLVKTVLSFASFFVSLVIMLFVREPVSDFVKDQTGIYAAIETSVSSFVEEKTQEIQAGQAQLTDKVIDSLNLPDVLTKSLEQSNSKAVYEQRGIQNIAAYITGWLTDLAFEAVCCIISFVVVWILLRIVTMVLAGIVRLPVLHQIDCIAGAICGLCTALIIIWIGGIVVTAFAAQDWGREALSMITQSTLLTFLYNNNFLLNALLKAVR